MILVYHDIKLKPDAENVVSLLNFIKQMYSLRKYEVVYLDEYNPDNPNQVVLTFDDGYKSVLKYVVPILKLFKYPFELFICENFINGAENGDKVFLNKKELLEVAKNGGRLQYHTKSHLDLSEIEDKTLLEDELRLPESLLTLFNAPQGGGIHGISFLEVQR